MSKTIASALMTDIQKNVTTLAKCVVITRKDGKTVRMTNHDTDITFESNVYRHDIPFVVSAVESGSQLAINNIDISFKLDGTVFVRSHFENGLYDHAECTMFFVDYETPSDGKMTMIKGWFGRIENGPNNVVRVTVTGLLKVLDFEVGREYQPSCDADLGDTRCKVAIRQEQIYSNYNSYTMGDWVYYYDPALMNAITLTNPSFDVDGARSEVQSITGWTKSAGASFFLATVNTSPTYGVVDTNVPAHGSYALWGSQDATAGSSGAEQYVYQDVGLVAAGVSAADIDAGKISLGLFALVSQSVYLLDPVRLRVELTDTNGEFVSAFDTNFMKLDSFGEWREKALVFPVYPNARFARIYLYMKKEDGIVYNAAFDNIRLYWWDHTAGTPYDDVVHRLTRIVAYDDRDIFRPKNPSFEQNNTVSNALSPTIGSWTTTGSWWRVVTSLGSLLPQDGDYFLAGGNDGGASQQTYTITQTFTLASAGIDASRILLGKIGGRFSARVGFAAINNAATVKLEFLNSLNVVQSTIYLINNTNYGATTDWDTLKEEFVIPVTATQAKITLQATSPTGSGNAQVAFDDVLFYFYDVERPIKTDPVSGQGNVSTVFDTSAGGYTFDGGLVWKGMPVYGKYDVVASVTDRKTFTGTAITGASGTYETGVIWWIRGANAGLKSVIRTWNSGTQAVTLYFRMPNDIAVGDRFIYIRSCQRRFTEDCLGVFQNSINFRGFPHLPGKLRLATASENTA